MGHPNVFRIQENYIVDSMCERRQNKIGEPSEFVLRIRVTRSLSGLRGECVLCELAFVYSFRVRVMYAHIIII